MLASTIPGPSVDFLDANGKVNPVWWNFLLTLLNRTGGASGASAGPPLVVSLSGSPFLFTAPSNGSLIVAGGGVSNMQYSRPGSAFLDVGQFYAPFPLNQDDQVRITYISPAPTVVFLPR